MLIPAVAASSIACTFEDAGRFLRLFVLSARVSPTSDRQNASRIDHNARTILKSTGVEGGGSLMVDVVGLGVRRRWNR